MIGLAMVSLVTVLGNSFKETLNGQLEDSVQADWMMCAGSCDNRELVFSHEAASALAGCRNSSRWRPSGTAPTGFAPPTAAGICSPRPASPRSRAMWTRVSSPAAWPAPVPAT